jgi:hypothetical protein
MAVFASCPASVPPIAATVIPAKAETTGATAATHWFAGKTSASSSRLVLAPRSRASFSRLFLAPLSRASFSRLFGLGLGSGSRLGLGSGSRSSSRLVGLGSGRVCDRTFLPLLEVRKQRTLVTLFHHRKARRWPLYIARMAQLP